MNRKIMFRGWDKGAKRWVEPEGARICFPWSQPFNPHTVITFGLTGDNIEWLEFTGLMDCKRKPIFEGDLILTSDGCVGAVEFIEKAACFDQNMLNTTGHWVVQTTGEVIGNIYEDEHILKGIKYGEPYVRNS